MIPIVVCTIGSPSLSVLEASVQAYAPKHPLIVHRGSTGSFGGDFNEALTQAFATHDEVILANDDVVLTPSTMDILLEDVDKLKKVVEKIGFVATMADNVRASQNIRMRVFADDEIVYGRWRSEGVIKQVPVIAPIFAWMPKQAFQAVQFPPITWWSDDIICEDFDKAGFKLFVSRAYVHHVGSNTIGTDYERLKNQALPWVQANRPHYMQELENRVTGKR